MLAAFEAAARAGSFSGAARELDLTQGAISRQIHALEDQLGVRLFQRTRQRVRLSAAGEVYVREVHQALNIIRAASLNLMSDPLGGALNLAILPTFGTRWLIPRLPHFLDRHPRITINFSMHLSPFDFAEEGLDAAIHYGKPDWPDADCTFLMAEEVIPVCSPAFLAQHKLAGPEGLLDLPLLHLSTRPAAWHEWFDHAGLGETPAPKPGMHFDQFATAAQAAVAGLGVALMPVFLIKAELDDGLLVPVFDGPISELSVLSASAYYFVAPHSRRDNPSVKAFRSWLLSETRPD